MNVVFISDRSSEDNSAYTNRILSLKAGIQRFGINTDIFYIGNSALKVPYLLQPLKTPQFASLIKKYDVVSLQGPVASYAMCIAKKYVHAKFLNIIHGNPIVCMHC